MNGSSNGREARSRKNIISSGNGSSSNVSNGGSVSINGNGGIYDVSDSGDSTRRSADRMAMRKKRVRRSRARKKQSNAIPLCILGGIIFVVYLLVCFIFFRNIPDGEARGMRGLVKKTKDKINKLRKRNTVIEEEIAKLEQEMGDNTNNNNNNQVRGDNNPAGQSDLVANSSKSSVVPIGIWPISIRNEDGKFEDIKHPGIDDGSVTMSVPQFWANDPVSIHENKLMSRERALSIGTCVTPDPKTGSNTRGDKCPLNERTIFVAIASYRDWQCRDTGEFFIAYLLMSPVEPMCICFCNEPNIFKTTTLLTDSELL